MPPLSSPTGLAPLPLLESITLSPFFSTSPYHKIDVDSQGNLVWDAVNSCLGWASLHDDIPQVCSFHCSHITLVRSAMYGCNNWLGSELLWMNKIDLLRNVVSWVHQPTASIIQITTNNWNSTHPSRISLSMQQARDCHTCAVQFSDNTMYSIHTVINQYHTLHSSPLIWHVGWAGEHTVKSFPPLVKGKTWLPVNDVESANP